MANFIVNPTYTPHSMKDFDKKIQLVMINFKKSTHEIKFDNSMFMTLVVQEIKKQNKIFRKFVEGSNKFSKDLEDHSTDILFFTNSFKNGRYSNEEILELSNDLLLKSKENLRLIKELKNIVSNEENIHEIENLDKILEGIKNDELANIGIKKILTMINKAIRVYKESIKKYPKLIDSVNVTQITKETNKRYNYYINSNIYNTIAFFAGMGFLAVTGPATVATAATVEGVTMILGATTATSMFLSFTEHMKAKEKKGSINDLEKKLIVEVNELNEKIDSFADNLQPIVKGINTIETFWVHQIEIIERLIKNLESFKKTAAKYQNNDANINRIEEEWKDVKHECQIYSHAMKDLLNEEKSWLK
ncbi:hypothetical protein RclHR1_08720009 [Rhizophagus clarus]|uniref:Uncharacterized protein n=1 Tax=Rhizophagus clarus TaxID=94130 RepID=A0A2Z6S233_9GLOM|nr:hypothetical protein RclHR1_08720009 [Rhizophagus clarus]GES82583.1 hypothetical protein GLOIN_2v1777098 [Rhizophagus clarus]